MLLVMSAASSESAPVRNEVMFAVDEQKPIIPLLLQDCAVPLHLRRIQHVDFRLNYSTGLRELLDHLGALAKNWPVAHPPVTKPASALQAPKPIYIPAKNSSDGTKRIRSFADWFSGQFERLAFLKSLTAMRVTRVAILLVAVTAGALAVAYRLNKHSTVAGSTAPKPIADARVEIKGGNPETGRTSTDSASGAAYEDYLEGVSYFERRDKPGNLDLAAKKFERAVQSDPRLTLADARLTQVHVLKYLLHPNPGDLQSAKDAGERAGRFNDKIATIHVALAQLNELLGRNDLATQEFQRAIDLDPRDSEAIGAMADFLSAQPGKEKEAADAYAQAEALDQNDWSLPNGFGLLYAKISNPKQAIAEYKRAIALTPDNAWVYNNLAMTDQDIGDLSGAEEAFRRSIALDPTASAYSNLASVYTQERRFEDSVKANLKALELDKDDPDVQNNLAESYEWLHMDREAAAARSKAISGYQEELKQNKRNASATAALAALFAKNGLTSDSRRCMVTALALSPNDKYVLSSVADAYEALGQRAQAIKYLREAVDHGFTDLDIAADPTLQSVIKDPQFTEAKRHEEKK